MQKPSAAARELISVNRSCQQNVHQLFINGVFRSVDLIDEDDHRMDFAALNGFDALFGAEIIHGIAIFVTDEGSVPCFCAATQRKDPLFLVLDPLDGIVRQKAEFGLAIFVLVLVRQTGNFAFL